MTMTDPIADLLTRIRNLNSMHRDDVRIPYSRIKEEILKTLHREGYITEYKVEGEGIARELVVTLKFSAEGERAITKLERVSRPGRRVYRKIGDLPQVLRGLGIWVLSTPNGILSDMEARAQKVGGEVLCKVY